jgi:hypothetical protein
MRHTIQLIASWASVCLVAVIAVPACASVQVEPTRAGLAGSDFLDWSDLGPSNTPAANPFVITSDDGANVTLSKTQSTNFVHVDQSTFWSGNFAPFAPLLWTGDFNSSPNVMRLTFGGPGISGGGAQIQADTFGAFTARIEAFDSTLTSLGFFDVNGNSTANGDDTAIFLGISDTTTPIYAIEISLVAAQSNILGSFAINQFDFSPAAATPAVPEAASLAVWSLLTAAAAIGLKSRRIGA